MAGDRLRMHVAGIWQAAILVPIAFGRQTDLGFERTLWVIVVPQ